MDTREYLQRIDDALKELGYEPRELRSGGHYSVVHESTGNRVFFPATPGDRRGMRNVLAELERAAGRRLAKQRGYSGGKRAPGYQRSIVHDKADTELEAREKIARSKAEIAALDSIIAWRVDTSHSPGEHRDEILRLLTTRKLCSRTLESLNQPIPPCDVPGLAALQAQWSAVSDDVPCTDDQIDMLRKRWDNNGRT